MRYSTGQPVEPLDFRRAIERDFRLHSPLAYLYRSIVGAAQCARHPSRCDLANGILTREDARTVTFKPLEPDPDFLYKLTLPDAAGVPDGVPPHDVGRRPVPATGPYMTHSYLPGRTLRLVRNPYFREWSQAAQPDGYVERVTCRPTRGAGMANPVVHFEVVGKDAATLTKFYGEAFGWQLQDVMEGSYYMVNTGGEGDIPGGIGAAPDGGPGNVMFYVQVDDPAAALEQIKSLGGRTVSEPMDVPGGPTIAHFADPEGHVVGLVKGT